MAAVAIIGGGVSGLAAAFALRRPGREVTVFEAGPRLGGRALTERHGSALFDVGAQFFRTETPAAEKLVLHELPAGELIDIRADVRPFTRDGAVGEGDPVQNRLPKWVYRQGIGQLAELLAREAGANVRLGWACTRLQHSPEGWIVEGEMGAAGPFEAVVATPPPPALGKVIERSSFEGEAREGLREALAPSRYTRSSR